MTGNVIVLFNTIVDHIIIEFVKPIKYIIFDQQQIRGIKIVVIGENAASKAIYNISILNVNELIH